MKTSGIQPEQEALRVLQQARGEFAALGEAWDHYVIDVELLATLLYAVGVQQVEDLRVKDREYAGFLDPAARLIAVEARHHPHRRRFSVAHEVGHFVLHYLPERGRAGLFTCTSRDMEESAVPAAGGARALHVRREVEANRFAGALLMPEESVRALHRVVGGRVLSLAKHFQVSAKAMEIRLTQLGLSFRPL